MIWRYFFISCFFLVQAVYYCSKGKGADDEKDVTGAKAKPEQVRFQIADDEEDDAIESNVSLIKKPEIVVDPPSYSQASNKV